MLQAHQPLRLMVAHMEPVKRRLVDEWAVKVKILAIPGPALLNRSRVWPLGPSQGGEIKLTNFCELVRFSFAINTSPDNPLPGVKTFGLAA